MTGIYFKGVIYCWVDVVDQFHGFILYFINGERLTDIIEQKDEVALIYLCLKVGVGGGVD